MIGETYYIEEVEANLDDAPGGYWIMAEGERPETSALPGPYVRKCGWFETKAEAEQRLGDLKASGEKVRYG